MGPLIGHEHWPNGCRNVVVLDVRWRLGRASTYEEFWPATCPEQPGRRWTSTSRIHLEPVGDTRFGSRRLQDRLRECGIEDDSQLVVYDNADSTAAARAWWCCVGPACRRSACSTESRPRGSLPRERSRPAGQSAGGAPAQSRYGRRHAGRRRGVPPSSRSRGPVVRGRRPAVPR